MFFGLVLQYLPDEYGYRSEAGLGGESASWELNASGRKLWGRGSSFVIKNASWGLHRPTCFIRSGHFGRRLRGRRFSFMRSEGKSGWGDPNGRGGGGKVFFLFRKREGDGEGKLVDACSLPRGQLPRKGGRTHGGTGSHTWHVSTSGYTYRKLGDFDPLFV